MAAYVSFTYLRSAETGRAEAASTLRLPSRDISELSEIASAQFTVDPYRAPLPCHAQTGPTHRGKGVERWGRREGGGGRGEGVETTSHTPQILGSQQSTEGEELVAWQPKSSDSADSNNFVPSSARTILVMTFDLTSEMRTCCILARDRVI